MNTATIRLYGAGPTEVRTIHFDRLPVEVRNRVLNSAFAVAAAYGMCQIEPADEAADEVLTAFCRAVQAMERCGEVTFEQPAGVAQ